MRARRLFLAALAAFSMILTLAGPASATTRGASCTGGGSTYTVQVDSRPSGGQVQIVGVWMRSTAARGGYANLPGVMAGSHYLPAGNSWVRFSEFDYKFTPVGSTLYWQGQTTSGSNVCGGSIGLGSG